MQIGHHRRPGAGLLLAALLSTVWAGNAGAVDVVFVGPAGSSGLNGAVPGAAGGNGQSAAPVNWSLLNVDPVSNISITGGAGGTGGNGADGSGAINGGNAGTGGNGAATSASLSSVVSAPVSSLVLHSVGGLGGDSGFPGAAGSSSLAGNESMAGDGGNASASNTLSAGSSGITDLTLYASATGGNGGNTLFGVAGRGGDAYSEVLAPTLGGATSVTVNSLAIGGNGGNAAFNPDSPFAGTAGGGGGAVSVVTLNSTTPLDGGWSANISAGSTAIAGMPGSSPFSPSGLNAEATSSVQGYGKVSSAAVASGGSGAGDGGYGTATAVASSNYIANANATANGGSSFFNPGAGATARATANSSYYASADAVAAGGTGHAGAMGGAIAIAEANVVRSASSGLPPSPEVAAEARAHALAGTPGSEATARSSFSDSVKNAAVVASAGTQGVAGNYNPEAFSAANVGGDAYAAWTGPNGGNPSVVVSYASALPTAASVSSLLADSPNVQAAVADAQVLGAGTVGAMFFPFSSSAAFTLPFTSGEHLLLGLVAPFAIADFPVAFEFSVSNGGSTLYAGSFTSPTAAASFFTDHVLDLGVLNASTLNLLVSFSLTEGAYGFSYVLAQGAAPVPEPGTWLLLVLGALVMAWRLRSKLPHSTVTDFAKLRGLSTSVPRATAA